MSKRSFSARMRRREDEGEPSRRYARHRTSPGPARGEDHEEAIRTKLRESGWKKRRTESESAADAESFQDKETAKEKGDKSVPRGLDDRQSSRTSRSSRRPRSPRRRDHEHRSSRRKTSGSRRRSPSRSRSHSRSTGRRRRHHSSSLRKRRSSRSLSRGRDGKRVTRSRSTSVSKKKLSLTLKSEEEKEKKKKEDEDEEDVAMEEDGDNLSKDDEKERGRKEETGDLEKQKHERPRTSSSRKSSRRSRSGSPRSPSKPSRRHHHLRNSSYSRSSSPLRSRRARRGSSRSRSHSTPKDRRSRGRNRDRRSRRRGRSYSRSRSPSYSRGHRRVERSSSREKLRRDANSSPEAYQHPPVSTDAPPAAPSAASTGVNPTITQLMAQYPTMSLQDIIAKMQASNVTMAAAVAQKPARELYVGNLPPNVTGPQLQEFLSTIIQQVGLTTQPGNPIVNTWISTDGHFAFCEMRSVDECNLALLLNQLSLLGQPLKFGRPRSFMGPPQPMPQISPRTQTALTNLGCTPNPAWFAQPSFLGITEATAEPSILPGSIPSVLSDFNPAITATTAVNAGSRHLIMSNIPVVLAEDQVKELVEPFGALKRFTLVKDAATGASMGSALFEYEDDGVASQAAEGLNGLSIGGILLSVQRQSLASGVALGALPRVDSNSEDQPSAVLKMANMVSVDELRDDEEYADLAEDVEEECKRFGNVTGLEIPRPKEGEKVPGVGCIYVCFGKEEDAASALKALNRRKFGGNIVQVTYFPMNKFEQREFS